MDRQKIVILYTITNHYHHVCEPPDADHKPDRDEKLLITLVAMMFVNAIPTHAQRQTTRGIGVYPGRQSESFAPTLRRDFDYRNTALHRMVYQSSSLDANLTGQLVTDGTVYRGEPCRLQVSMPDGVVARAMPRNCSTATCIPV